MNLADVTASAIADKITELVDAGSGPGTITVYTGSEPADLDPTGETALAVFSLVDPAAAAAAAGVAAYDLSTPVTATVDVTGTPGWFLVEDSDGNDVFSGSVGKTGADMNFPSTSWVAGDTVSLTSGTVTEPTA